MAGSIGFIGLGNMGLPMVGNLSRAGHSLQVFDIRPEACAQATQMAGVEAAASPAAAAEGSEVLFTVLPDDGTVADTYLGDGGVLSAAAPGLITCDCSTVSPAVTLRLHEAAADKGVHHLDTPMLGSQPEAVSGNIFFIVGGAAEHLPRIAPLLEAMGGKHMHVGPAGTANRIKLIHNALGAANAAAVAESLALCVQAGVAPEIFRQVVTAGSGMAYTTYFGKRAERIIAGDYSRQFSLALMHKDVSLAMAMAKEHDAPARIMEETLRAFAEGMEERWREEDFSAVTRVIEKKIGRSIGGK